MELSIHFHRSFHQLPSKFPTTFIYIYCIYFHGTFHLLPDCLEVCCSSFHGSMPASIEVTATSMKATYYLHLPPFTSIYFYGSMICLQHCWNFPFGTLMLPGSSALLLLFLEVDGRFHGKFRWSHGSSVSLRDSYGSFRRSCGKSQLKSPWNHPWNFPVGFLVDQWKFPRKLSRSCVYLYERLRTLRTCTYFHLLPLYRTSTGFKRKPT